MNGRNIPKKRLVIGITVLLVGITVFPTIGSFEIEKHDLVDKGVGSAGFNLGRNVIYVDDDNTMGPWDGSLEHPYQYIEDGIDNASDGDTVYVFNGTYYENVVVNKTISLIGEDKNNVIVDGVGTGSVISVFVDWVNISGFMIRNSGNESLDAGIYAYWSGFIVISGNIITSNGADGIIIYDNCFFYTISENTITENNNSGIYNFGSWWGVVSDNIIANNEEGIHIDYSSYNNFFNNTITNNSRGIYAFYFAKSYVFDNIITNNKECGFYSPGLLYSTCIFNNNFSDNNGSGIFFEQSHQNLIFCNAINRNGEYGIYFLSSANTHIYDNIIRDNLDCGIRCISDTSGNSYYHNNLINNAQNAMHPTNPWNDSGWDAGYPLGGNYWSDFNEPSEGAYDNNSDNIVDDPYSVPGGNEKDNYPLLYPWNETLLTKPNCGDANNDGTVNIADVVYIVNYLFINGPEPLPGLCVGDCNADESVDVADAVYLINYLFNNGSSPESCCEIKVVCGDVNGNRLVDYLDYLFLDNYVTFNGPAPDPLCVGDVNGDGLVDQADVTYLLDYYYGGPPPIPGCCEGGI